MGWRWTPVDAVGLYVPGGTAAYPSSVLMNAIPARIAGCPRLVMTVPAPDGTRTRWCSPPPRSPGSTRSGGSAVHRPSPRWPMAPRSIRPSTRSSGRATRYVAEAKRQVFGRVGIDMIAGPSEVVVVADRNNDPSWIAADLLAQAEHDERAQAVLLTDDAEFADIVAREVDRQLQSLQRAEAAAASWREHGAIVVVGSLDDAPPLIDRLAPEHLELAVADPEPLAGRAWARWSDLPRCLVARSDRRLCRRAQSRAAHRPHGQVRLGPVGARLLQANDHSRLRSGKLRRARAERPALARAEGLEAHARAVEYRLAGPGLTR